MVSLAEASAVNRYDRVSQSADYAVRELLTEGDDPLALASYLWVYQQHNLTSINGKALVRWAENWIRQVFIERTVSVRYDEAVASAAIAVAALSNTSSLSNMIDELKVGISQVLSEELSRAAIPFRRISYGAMLIVGAGSIGAAAPPRIAEAISEITRQFFEATPGGRMHGLQYASLLTTWTNTISAEEMIDRVHNALVSAKIAWDDQIYLVLSLWVLQGDKSPSKHLLQLTEEALLRSPVWGYLMIGMEDMPPAGDGSAVVKVSHLYRAALLDVLTRYQANSELRDEIRFRERYQGRRGVGISAFAFYVLLLATVWFVLLRFMVPTFGRGLEFWFRHDYSSMSRFAAVAFFFGVIGLLYLANITLEMLPALYSVLIRLNIQSDQRAWNVLWPRLRRITKRWAVIGIGMLAVGIIVNVITPSVEHIINEGRR